MERVAKRVFRLDLRSNLVGAHSPGLDLLFSPSRAYESWTLLAQTNIRTRSCNSIQNGTRKESNSYRRNCYCKVSTMSQHLAQSSNLHLRQIRQSVADRIQELKSTVPGFPVPQLVIVQVGHRQDSTTYVKMKSKACEEVGIKFTHVQVGCMSRCWLSANHLSIVVP